MADTPPPAPAAGSGTAQGEAAPGSPGLRRNAIANIGGRVASALLQIVVTPFVLGHLGPERYGVWALIYALSGYLGILDFGMAGGVSRFVAVAAARRDRREAGRLIARSMVLSVGLGVLWMVVFVAGRGAFLRAFRIPDVHHAEVAASLVVFGASLIAFSASQVLQWSLAGFQRLDLFNLYFLAGLAVNTAVLVAGLERGGGLVATAWAALAGHGVVGLMAWRSVRARLARLEPGAGAPRFSWAELLRFGGVIQAGNAFAVAQFQAGRVLLGALGTLVSVTTFDLAFRATNSLWSLAVMVQLPAYPATAHAHETGGLPAVRAVYEWCCRWVFLIAGWTLGLLWLTAPHLFHLWLGSPQPEVAAAARWLAPALALSTLAGPATPVARGIGRPGYEALNFAVAFAVQVVAGLALVPVRGVQGAALAMAVSFAVATTVLLASFHRRLGVGTWDWLGRVAAPRLLPAAALAALLAVPAARWTPGSRLSALAAVALEGIAFTAGYLALTWRTGDPGAIRDRALGWLRRLARPPGPEGLPPP